MKKILVWMMYMLAFLVVLSGVFLAGIEAGSVIQNPLLGFVGVYVGMILVFYISMVLHELGHAVLGFVTGYDVVVLGIGNLAFVKKDGAFKIEKTTLQPGIAAQYIGVKHDESDKRYFWMLAGGLTAHALIMVVGAVVGALSGKWGIAYPIMSMNAALFLLNAVPVGVTDAAKIFELHRFPSHLPFMYRALRHTAATYLSPDDKRLSDFVTEVPEEEGVIVQGMWLNTIETLVIEGELEEARCQIDKLLLQAESSYIRPLAEVTQLQILLLQNEVDEAGKLGKEKSVRGIFNTKMANVQAIRALYEVRVTKEVTAARETLQRAKQYIPTSRFLKDEKQYYTDLIQRVEDECEAWSKMTNLGA